MTEKPKLGTIDSALVSCVDMLAALTSQRVDQLVCWLDLYYQVRKWWEICQGNETDPQLIRKDDLLPMLDAVVSEALHGTAQKAAEAAMAKKKTRKPAARPEPAEPDTSSGPEGHLPLEGKAKEEMPEAAPATTPERPGPWTLYKRKIYSKLQQARAEGYTIAQIVEASGGALSDGKVIGAINAKPLRAEEWKALENALAAVMLLQIPEGSANG